MKFKDYYNETLEALVYILEYTVKDFNKIVPSKRNRDWLKKRRDSGKTGSFLEDVLWNVSKDTLLLKYRQIPTPTIPILKVSKKGNKSNTKIYNMEIQFIDVSKYLGNMKDYLIQTKGEQIVRSRDMIRKATVKVHSNAPDFLFQGSWRHAFDNNYNIYSIPTMKDTGVWKKRHENKNEYITKGLLEIIQTIPFNADKIAELIRDKYSI